MNSEESINSFDIKNEYITWIFIEQLFCLPIYW